MLIFLTEPTMLVIDNETVKIELVENTDGESFEDNKNVICPSSSGTTTIIFQNHGLDGDYDILKSEVIKEEERFGNEIINAGHIGVKEENIVVSSEQHQLVSTRK